MNGREKIITVAEGNIILLRDCKSRRAGVPESLGGREKITTVAEGNIILLRDCKSRRAKSRRAKSRRASAPKNQGQEAI